MGELLGSGYELNLFCSLAVAAIGTPAPRSPAALLLAGRNDKRDKGAGEVLY